MQDMNNTPNTEQNRSSAPADKWKELLETPEVMSSSGSPSSRDNPAPADYPWDVESSSAPSSSSSKVSITWEDPPFEPVPESGASTTKCGAVTVTVSCRKDYLTNTWRGLVLKATAKCTVKIRYLGYRNPVQQPPVTETEAIDAVNTMNAYMMNGVGSWHTMGATETHEQHHVDAWHDTNNYYWEEFNVQRNIEDIAVSCSAYPNEGDAMDEILRQSKQFIIDLRVTAANYYTSLGDSPGDYPYRAGQAALNDTTRFVQDMAREKGWNRVSADITDPGTYTPPCYIPPVSEYYSQRSARSFSQQKNIMPSDVELTVNNVENWQTQPIVATIHNKGTASVRIVDPLHPEPISDAFFGYRVKNAQGRFILGAGLDLMVNFCSPISYLEIGPGESYSMELPLHEQARELYPEGVPKGEHILEVTYLAQYGENCLKGSLNNSSPLFIM